MSLAKNYFTIKEISKITGIKPHIIRYWEKKLNLITPIRLESQHRRYTRKDIESIILIKDLLYIHGYSLNGIRKILKTKTTKQQLKDNITNTSNKKHKDILLQINEEIKKTINEIKNI